jgi:group I intron endonuclease
MKGIYKITNPENKIYIGQSTDIERRFKDYKNLRCGSQRLIFESLAKYGWLNHKFEILEECENLNEKEQYWINEFKSTTTGLNQVGVYNRRNFIYPDSAKKIKSIKMKKLHKTGEFKRIWAKKCKHLETGKVYDSLKEAQTDLKISYTKLYKMLGEAKTLSYIYIQD